MLSVIKNLFATEKDYAGRNIESVINRLAAQTNSSVYEWSYIRENSVYENTITGTRIYPHELAKRAA
jgi:hypothetical protein